MHAQNSGHGLFLTREDFLNHKVFPISTKNRIKLHEFFKKDIVEVKTKDSTYSFLKKDVFGYRDNDGNIFRIFDNKIFPLINPNENIILYRVSEGPPQKGQIETFAYFFSKDAGSDILPLSIYHLNSAFSHNKKFQNLLEICYSHMGSLLEYDDVHQVYKVNRLLEISKQ